MEKGRPARCARPSPTDRHHTPGSDCCRLPGINWHIARDIPGARLLCALGLCRRWIDVCRHQRLLRNGAPAGADALESPDRARGLTCCTTCLPLYQEARSVLSLVL